MRLASVHLVQLGHAMVSERLARAGVDQVVARISAVVVADLVLKRLVAAVARAQLVLAVARAQSELAVVVAVQGLKAAVADSRSTTHLRRCWVVVISRPRKNVSRDSETVLQTVAAFGGYFLRASSRSTISTKPFPPSRLATKAGRFFSLDSNFTILATANDV